MSQSFEVENMPYLTLPLCIMTYPLCPLQERSVLLWLACRNRNGLSSHLQRNSWT
jgi:hypothetical protein